MNLIKYMHKINNFNEHISIKNKFINHMYNSI